MSGSRDQSDQSGGPGWRRMRGRLGPERMEEMRLRVLREREEELARTNMLPAADPATDRDTYRGYPAPRLRPRRRKNPTIPQFREVRKGGEQ